jgi:hypothetical protein
MDSAPIPNCWATSSAGTGGHAERARLHPLPHIIPAMLAGLSLASWTLILLAVGAGLAIELVFLRAHRGERPSGDRPR